MGISATKIGESVGQAIADEAKKRGWDLKSLGVVRVSYDQLPTAKDRVDGATSVGIFRQLTIPHLRRYLELGALLGSIYIIQAFDAIDVMTGGAPGSKNVPYFVYQESIGGGFRYGSASAYAIVVVIASIVIATFALRVLSGLLKDEARA